MCYVKRFEIPWITICHRSHKSTCNCIFQIFNTWTIGFQHVPRCPITVLIIIIKINESVRSCLSLSDRRLKYKTSIRENKTSLCAIYFYNGRIAQVSEESRFDYREISALFQNIRKFLQTSQFTMFHAMYSSSFALNLTKIDRRSKRL